MGAENAEQGEPVAYLRVGGEEFRCSDRVSFWLIAKVSRLETRGASDAEMVPVYYDLVMGLLDPSERDRADSALSQMRDLTPLALSKAVSDALGEMSALPKASATPSSHGSVNPGTPTTSRVVSFSRGTVHEAPAVDPGDSAPSDSSTD